MRIIETVQTTVSADSGEEIGTITTTVYRQSWPWERVTGEWRRARLWVTHQTDGWHGGAGTVLMRVGSVGAAHECHSAVVANYRHEAKEGEGR